MATSSIRKSKERTLVLGLIATVFLTLLILRLFWLQTFASDKLMVEAQKNWIANKILRPDRGAIYERTKQQKLAWESDAYVFGAALDQIKDPKKTAKVLSPILNVPQDQIEKKLTIQPTKDRKSIELRFPGKYKYSKQT